MIEVPQEEIDAFGTTPLAPLDLSKYLVFQTRADMGLPPLPETLGFNVDKHKSAQSKVARDISERLKVSAPRNIRVVIF